MGDGSQYAVKRQGYRSIGQRLGVLLGIFKLLRNNARKLCDLAKQRCFFRYGQRRRQPLAKEAERKSHNKILGIERFGTVAIYQIG